MKNVRELLKVNEESLPKLYCDLDQVLCAFLDGAKFVLGQDFVKSDRETRWKKIGNTKGFWANLPWFRGGKRLYSFIAKYDPYILSAHSTSDTNSKRGKNKWLDKNTKIPKGKRNIVLREQKKKYAVNRDGSSNLLIDDYIKNIKEWETAGGIGIVHTDTGKTLGELKKLGFK